MRRLPLLLLAALPTAGLAAPASSGGGYSVQIEDERGGALSTWQHRGSTYVLGSYGQRYNVRVFNHTGQRVEAVVTVDGRDAISGAVGDYVRQRGYIVPPWGSVLVEGFRQSHSSVAAFRFTSPGDSYSGRMGTPHNVGVVGVAVFRERSRRPVAIAPPPRPRPRPTWGGDFEARKRDAAGGLGTSGPSADDLAAPESEASPAPREGAPARRSRRKQNLGTQYGESHHSPVVEVPFRRARPRSPDRLLAVYYDDAEGLAARGIRIYPRPYYSGEPSPFPNRFAPPPPGY